MARIAAWLLLLAVSGVIGFCPVQQPCSARYCVNSWKPAFSTTTRQSSSSSSSSSSSNEQDDRPRRERKWRRRFKKTAASVALGWSLFMPAAHARKADFDSTARANDILMQSIQPGATISEAQQSMDGQAVTFEEEQERMEGISSAASSEDDGTDDGNSKKKKNKKKKDDLYADLEFDEDDEDADVLMDDVEELDLKEQKGKTTTASAKGFYSSEVDQSMYNAPYIAFAVVPAVFLVVREMIRRKQEAAYVTKALKIVENQRAEYLRSKKNETETNSTATDEEAAEDDEGDGDDDGGDGDDDDDEYLELDDEDEEGGDDESGDDEGPTQEDIDRLNKLMGR